jgi:putative sigma-54 modulation protein
MQISVTFRQIEPAAPLREYAEQRISKVKKYLEEPLEAHIVLSIQKFRHMADVTLITNGYKIKGQESTGDLYSAIDLVVDKIEKQIKKYRERLKEHKPAGKTPASPRVAMNVLAREEASAASEEPRIIKSETIFAKPMDIEEAMMQLNLMNNDFLVFTNSKTGHINVIYHRKDGNYGLIEPLS